MDSMGPLNFGDPAGSGGPTPGLTGAFSLGRPEPRVLPESRFIPTGTAAFTAPPDTAAPPPAQPSPEESPDVAIRRMQWAHADQAYRKKVLEAINTPYSAEEHIHFVNPVTHWAQWGTNVAEAVKAPWREAWNDTHWWGPVHKVLAVLGTPMSALAGATTATMGLRPASSFSEAIARGAAEANYTTVGAILPILGGIALDFASDPLNFVDFGADQEWEAARKLMDRTPPLGGITSADKLAAAQKWLRFSHNPDMQGIANYAAPMMAWDNLKGVFAHAHPQDADGALFRSGAGRLGELMFGAGRDVPLDAAGTTYRSLVNEIRQGASPSDLQEWRRLGDDVADPAMPLLESARRLARHQVGLETAIWHGRPGLRLLGRPIEVLGRRIPNPLGVLGSMFTAPLGKWTPQATTVTPISELGTPAANAVGRDVRNIAKLWYPKMTDDHADVLTAKDLDTILMDQQASTRYRIENRPGKAALEGALPGKGTLTEGKHLRSWLGHIFSGSQMGEDADREMATRIAGMYGILAEAAEREPLAAYSRTAEQYRAAEKTILAERDRLPELVANHEAKLARSAKKAQPYTEQATGRPVVIPPKSTTSAASVTTRFATLLHELHDAVNAIETPGAGEAPGPGVLEQAARIIATARGDFEHAGTAEVAHRPVDAIMGELFSVFNESKAGAMPIAHSVVDWATRRDWASHLDQIRAELPRIMSWADNYFTRAESVPFVQALGKMMKTPGGKRFLRAIAARGEEIEGAAAGKTAVRDLGEVKDAFAKGLASTVKKGQIGQEEAQVLADHFGSLTDDQWEKSAYALDHIRMAKREAGFRSEVMAYLTFPARRALEKVEGLLRSTYLVDYQRILNDAARYQERLTPHRWSPAIYQRLVDKMDDLKDTIFRRVGLTPAADEAMRDIEDGRDANKRESERYGMEDVDEALREAAKQAAPDRFKEGIGRADHEKLQRGYAVVATNRHSLDYEDPKADAGFLHEEGGPAFLAAQGAKTWSEYVRRVAAENVARGEGMLREAFGGDNAAAAAFLESEPLAGESGKMLAKEQALGMVGMSRQGYFPYRLQGGFLDKREWNNYLRRFADTTGLGANTAEKGPLLVKRFGPGLTRHFPDMGAVQALLNFRNHFLTESGARALDLRPVEHTSNLMAERMRAHLDGILHRRAIEDLHAALPDYIRIFRKTPASDDWKAIDPLIPSLAGKGWHIHKDLYKYLETYLPPEEREETWWDTLLRANNWLVRMNTNFSLYHLKNQIAEGAIAGAPVESVVDLLKFAWKNRDRGEHIGAFSPLERMRYALDKHPDIQEMTRSGVRHFTGQSELTSVGDRVEERMHPTYGAASAWFGLQKGQGRLGRLGTPHGPFSTLIFDIFDRALKGAVYRKFRDAGIPGRAAADATNHFMIDYSARELTPAARRLGRAMFPFFSWHIGNALLHIPNMLQNPRMYALLATIEQEFGEKYSPFSGLPTEMVPQTAAFAVATPYTNDDGYQRWILPELPWDPYLKLLRSSMQNPLALGYQRNVALRWLLQRTRFANPIMEAAGTSEFLRSEKETPMQELLGTMNRPGWLQEVGWGLTPWARGAQSLTRSLFDHDGWSDEKWAALSMFIRNEALDYKGRIKTDEHWKQALPVFLQNLLQGK